MIKQEYYKSFEKLKTDLISRAGLHTKEASGFYAVYCPVCGKENKKTGGFRIEDDSIIYNCFRGSCDGTVVYEAGTPISKKFRRLMDLYGVQIPADLRMIRSTFKRELENLDESLYKKNQYKDCDEPEYMVEFEDAPSHFKNHWVKEFDKRKTPLDDTYIINKGRYKGCCAIEMKFYERTIAYQIHTLNGNYVMHSNGNSNPIYLPEHVVPDSPIILVEGTFDAKCFPNAVATMKKTITPEQAFHLRGKEVIMLPDKTGNHFIDVFSDYGWSMALPDWDVKDLNAAVCKYGILSAARMIRESIITDKLKAKTKYKIWSRKYKNG